jgi:hypothetical protein
VESLHRAQWPAAKPATVVGSVEHTEADLEK